jgi:hypothetical protein
VGCTARWFGPASWIGVSLLALAADPVAARAQTDPKPDVVWTLEGLRNGWCLQFLIDPKDANEDLPRGARPLPASQAPNLHPAVRRLIADEPQYAAWIPSQVCAYFFQAVVIGKQRISSNNPKNAPGLLWWGVWSSSNVGADTAGRYALRCLGSNEGKIEGSSDLGQSRVSMEDVDLLASKVPDSQDDRYVLGYEKTIITFDGHPAPDSLAPGELHQAWLADGTNSKVLTASIALRPAATHGLAGALRIQGKGELASALLASPIRLVGPVQSGGDGEILFFVKR